MNLLCWLFHSYSLITKEFLTGTLAKGSHVVQSGFIYKCKRCDNTKVDIKSTIFNDVPSYYARDGLTLEEYEALKAHNRGCCVDYTLETENCTIPH